MKKALIGTAALAALSLTGFAAHASCFDPRSANQGSAGQMGPLSLHQGAGADHFESAAEGIVGTWHVIYTPEGTTKEMGEAFIQWHRDGTEWENINYPVLNGNICMGSWKSIDQWHVFRNHVGWLYVNGNIAGYFNETETDALAWDGNSYSGTYETTLYFTGSAPIALKGSSVATKIWP